MVIRELGKVVGLLDDKSLKLTEVESDRLQDVVDGMREDGIWFMGASEEKLQEGQDCGTEWLSVPFSSDNLEYIVNGLIDEDFEVQTA